MTSCFLSLGSNVGDRLSNINTAISHISTLRENIVIAESNIYESDAMYNENLDKFYNCVIKLKTQLSPSELLSFLKDIERKMGRNLNEKRYSPRIIDIDILTYGKEVVDSLALKIPHPHIKERKFVLKPWSDIDSHYIMANCNKKIFDLLDNISDNTQLRDIKK